MRPTSTAPKDAAVGAAEAAIAATGSGADSNASLGAANAAIATSAPSTGSSADSSAASIRRLWVLMATVFVDMIGAMIVLPLLPFYVLDMGAKPSIVGPLVSAFFIAQMICSP
ncbi:MAG TPA: hypothetical protein VE075_12600, partial [Thermoanaerobaculia bacterium]|nr:hypothetical protein [Thermoanaerobaculia bacterium]